MNTLRKSCAIAAFLFGLGLPGTSWAFSLTPISQVLAPSGSGSTCAYVVQNTRDEPIAVEFFVAQLVKRLDGSEDLSRRDEDNFSVFPPQAVLAPGASRTVRVRWLGPPEVEHEQSFRFMAEQIPVSLDDPAAASQGSDDAKGSLKFHYKYHGTLFVRPKGAQPDIEVVGVEVVQGDQGPGMRIRVENTGSMRGWMRSFNLSLEIEGQVYELTEREFPALENLPVLAAGQREVIAAWPAGVPVGKPSSANLTVSY